MAIAFWWQQPGYVNLLADMAADLDRQYPGRPIYAVGHSPSWLVYAVGALRAARGEEPRIGYIPHSGKLHELDRNDLFKVAGPATVVHYTASKQKAASDSAITNYFNFLSRRHVDPRHVQEKHAGQGTPVLLDFLAHGAGFATFLRLYNDMAEKQAAPTPVGGGFKVHAYKMGYASGPVTLHIEPLPPGSATAAIEVPVTITSGVPGDLMNTLAGYSGYAAANDQSARRLDAGRFMPYYPVGDHYPEGSYSRNYPAPVNGLRTAPPDRERRMEIKTAIRDAVALLINEPESHAVRVTEGAQTVSKNAPRSMEKDTVRWTVTRGYH